LRTIRPYRGAWAAEKVVSYLKEKAGTEFDPEIATAFIGMMERWENLVTIVTDENQPIAMNAIQGSATTTQGVGSRE
jgi:HD-GYP domain-containing protein (c-di-GMP phosphodiesterase class II)